MPVTMPVAMPVALPVAGEVVVAHDAPRIERGVIISTLRAGLLALLLLLTHIEAAAARLAEVCVGGVQQRAGLALLLCAGVPGEPHAADDANLGVEVVVCFTVPALLALALTHGCGALVHAGVLGHAQGNDVEGVELGAGGLGGGCGAVTFALMYWSAHVLVLVAVGDEVQRRAGIATLVACVGGDVEEGVLEQVEDVLCGDLDAEARDLAVVRWTI
jgi:hypothetical protein